ncbi:hypothetical protein DPMN_089448 [Dreissena polymorpha]|uniref:Uncharacterized protein n=1 Tax=Dreissena polymorpha TaxID=45954 RepID=A0A9D4KVZ8_DREPO|nr:hypothetical protein DPMN_089448 [Dreissena polymorpha]
MTRINDLEKQLSQRLGFKKINERFIEKLAEAKKDDMLQYESTIEALQNKVSSHQSLNEKIVSLTDVESTPDEMLVSEEYTFDLEVKLRKFRQYLLQHSTSKYALVEPT